MGQKRQRWLQMDVEVSLTPVGSPPSLTMCFPYPFRRSSTIQRAPLVPLLLYPHELPWAPLPPIYPRVMAGCSPTQHLGAAVIADELSHSLASSCR